MPPSCLAGLQSIHPPPPQMKKFAFLPALMAIAAITPSLTVAQDTQILQTAPLPATNFVAPPSPYDGTDTLRYFRSKCTLIVVASVTSALGHSGSRPVYEPGLSNFEV